MLSIDEQVELLMRGTKFADETAEYGDPEGDSQLRKLCAGELRSLVRNRKPELNIP